MRFFQVVSVLIVGLASFSVSAQGISGLSDTQKKDVEKVVRELLLKKEPDLIVKAAQEVQRRAEKVDSEKGRESLAKNKKELFDDPDSPTAGNPKGDVTIVEFFDYSCGYCKVVQPTIQELLDTDKNIRFVFKEFPILGSESVLASKAALAAAKQGKYAQMHAGLMASKERLAQAGVLRVAAGAGLDVERLEKDMEDPAIMKIIEKNNRLGSAIGARGTPTFIVGDKLYPGALPIEQIKEIVEETRKGAAQE